MRTIELDMKSGNCKWHLSSIFPTIEPDSGVFKVKMSLGRAMITTDLNGGLTRGVGTLGPASEAGFFKGYVLLQDKSRLRRRNFRVPDSHLKRVLFLI